MKRLLHAVLLFLLCSSQLTARYLPDPESRGVWVTGNYLSGGPTAIENLVENVASAHLNVIYIDVWYEGSTIYPSSVDSTAGGPLQNPAFAGTDPLRTLIDIAHKHGIEVFAWFEYGFSVGHSNDSTNVPPILRIHPDWAMVQRDTTKDFYHNQYGYFFAVDPSVTAAANFAVGLYTECAKNYPDIDGIETDIENDTTMSYSDTARIRFMQETGSHDPLTLPSNDPTWLSWRRLQITNIVKRIYDGVKKINPDCVVSGAVPPPWMANSTLEEWSDWADSGYIDLAEPMMYFTLSDWDLSYPLWKHMVPSNFYLYPGISIAAAGGIQNAITEIRSARQQGLQGETLWYYGYLQGNGYLGSLRNSVYQSVTLPSHDDILVDNATQGAFSTQGSWTLVNGGYRGSYLVSTSSTSNSATYAFRILRSGDYSMYGFWSGDSSSNCRSVLVNVVSGSISKVDTVDQSKGLNTWNLVDGFSLNSGDTVRVTMVGSGSGNVIADAFRLRRGIALQLEDEAVPDSGHVLLKFNQDILNPVASCTKVCLVQRKAG